MAAYWATPTAVATTTASASASVTILFKVGDHSKSVSLTLPNASQMSTALADLAVWLNRQRRPLDAKDGVTSL